MDKALLDKPYTIHNVEVELKKDEQPQAGMFTYFFDIFVCDHNS